MIDTLRITIPLALATFEVVAALLTRLAERSGSELPEVDRLWSWGCWRSLRERDRGSLAAYHAAYRSGRCEFRLELSEGCPQAALNITSLPASVNGDNVRLLSPAGCRNALAAIDAQLRVLGLPSIWLWEVSEVHYSFDFLVDRRYVFEYLWSFAQRQPHLRGQPSERSRFGPDEGSISWWWDKHRRSLILYSKYAEVPFTLRSKTNEGQLRFEARLRRDGCNELAVQRGFPGERLTVADAIEPALAYSVLKRYLDALDAHLPIKTSRAVCEALKQVPRRAERLVFEWICDALVRGDPYECIRQWLADHGYREHRALERRLTRLRELGVVPGANCEHELPGLVLPPFDEFAGWSTWVLSGLSDTNQENEQVGGIL